MRTEGRLSDRVAHPASRILHAVFNCLLLLLCAHPSLAEAGLVETLDGQTLEGDIHLEAPGLLVVSSNAERAEISLTNLLRADFSTPTNAAAPLRNPKLAPGTIDQERGALPPPWQSLTIGSAEKKGGAVHYSGSFTVEAFPRTRKGRGEALHFIYQRWSGDGELVARVASLQPRDAKAQQARAGVMMRATLEPESPNVSLSLSGGLGSIFRRWSRKGEKVIDDQRPDLKPPYWIKLTRENGLITGYHSTDGKSWKLAGSSETDLPERIYVGLMVMSRRRDPAEATLDHVSVRPIVPRSEFTPRVVLRDGTVIADHLVAMDDAVITFSRDKQCLKVLTADVARLLFQPMFEAASLTPGRTGLLLSNGDFIDGEFRGLEAGRVKISSVLFGQRHYEVDRKIAAVVLRNVSPRTAPYEITSRDGSVWHPGQIRLEHDRLYLEEPLAGTWEIRSPDLLEIQRSATR